MALWKLPEREYQYIAVDFLVRKKDNLCTGHLDLIEYLIVTKSWWDTVDALASHAAGKIYYKYPECADNRGERWLTSGNMWLERTMLLFQLKYKDKTDEARLFLIIDRIKHIDEFFIQKAIGWALREYSNVRRYIESQDLSKLAKREGLKHIQKISLS